MDCKGLGEGVEVRVATTGVGAAERTRPLTAKEEKGGERYGDGSRVGVECRA